MSADAQVAIAEKCVLFYYFKRRCRSVACSQSLVVELSRLMETNEHKTSNTVETPNDQPL